MRSLVAGAACLVVLSACSDSSPNVILETDLGTIEIEVYPKKAPQTAADFLYYVDEKLYDGQSFYRTVTADTDPDQMGMSLIQGGRTDLQPITMLLRHEPTNQTGLSNVSGSVSVARDAPGSASAAFFFINVNDNLFLDYGGERNPDGQGYAVFGQVTDGMDVVKRIQSGQTKTDPSPPFSDGQVLVKPVVIKKAYRK
jgi:peptidyl-prolyl cis-trans isomerase A (cyclophilin A)